MRKVRIAELKDHLSEHLRSVEQGAKVLVLDRERAIAQILPISEPPRGVAIVPAARRMTAADRRAGARCDWGISSLELLLEERRDR